ncbi:hypothetical protein [Aeromonas enterica]
MPKDSKNVASKHFSGEIFDKPLIMEGFIESEPTRYIAEMPYDLTRYEFSIIKKPDNTEMYFNLFAGATIGLLISIIGKVAASLVAKEDPQLAGWEIISLVIGLLICLVTKRFVKSNEDKEKEDLLNAIEEHFINNKKRKLHVTKGEWQ